MTEIVFVQVNILIKNIGIVIIFADEHVSAVAAFQNVVSGTALQEIIAGTAEKRVIVIITEDVVAIDTAVNSIISSYRRNRRRSCQSRLRRKCDRFQSRRAVRPNRRRRKYNRLPCRRK